ncbi:Mfa1 family fimbria major subunit [Phocaeicola sp.]
MKKRNLFMLAFAALAFAACSNDDIVSQEGGDGSITNPTGEAWMSLSIQTPSSVAGRGLHNPDKENGTSAESLVSSLRVLFFDDDATDPKYVGEKVFANMAEAGNPGQPSGGVSQSFKVPEGAKRILIVANPGPGFPTTITPGTAYSAVNTAITETSVKTNLAASGKFMMSNAKGRLEPSLADGTDTDLALYSTADAASQHPLSIHIDRVVAKVRVYVTEASDVATVDLEGWTLNVTNTKYFPVSERTLTWNENPANTGARGTCITPYDLYKIGSYRVDPNYGNSNSPQALADYTVVTADPTAWTASGSAEYCLENTQVAADNLYKYTTQVLLKAKFVPKQYQKPDGTYSATQDADGWIMINNAGNAAEYGYFTFATLMEWIEAELNLKYAPGTPDPAGVATPITDEYNAYLAALGITPITLPTASGTSVSTLMTSFNATITTVKTKADRAQTVGNFTYYLGGYSYYRIMIKHDDTNAATNALGEFGVVRNSVYDINVTKFNNPGYPTIPEPGDEPDEEDKAWLAVQIDVNPWTWYTQTEEF